MGPRNRAPLAGAPPQLCRFSCARMDDICGQPFSILSGTASSSCVAVCCWKGLVLFLLLLQLSGKLKFTSQALLLSMKLSQQRRYMPYHVW